MTWKPLTPHCSQKSGSKDRAAIRMSVVTKKAGPHVLLTLNARAQAQFFRKPITDARFRVEIGAADHRDMLRLIEDSSGSFRPVRQPHGSARLSIKSWANYLRQRQPRTLCDVHWDGQGLLIELPEWAREAAGKAALDAEFGLKRPT